jgi:hypothetical protein
MHPVIRILDVYEPRGSLEPMAPPEVGGFELSELEPDLNLLVGRGATPKVLFKVHRALLVTVSTVFAQSFKHDVG